MAKVDSIAKVARAYGLDERTVGGWVPQGMPREEVSPRRFLYDLDEIFEWKVARDYATGHRHPAEGEVSIVEVNAYKSKLEDFKETKADRLAAQQMEALENVERIRKIKISDLKDEDIRGWTLNEAQRIMKGEVFNFAIAYDKEALERSKGVDNAHKILDAIMKIKELENRQ